MNFEVNESDTTMSFEQFSCRFESLFETAPDIELFMSFKQLESMLLVPLPDDVTGLYLKHIGLKSLSDVLSVSDQSKFNPNFNIPFWLRNIMGRVVNFIDQNTPWPDIRWLFMYEGRNRSIPAHAFLTPNKFYELVKQVDAPARNPAAPDRGVCVLNHDAHVAGFNKCMTETINRQARHYAHVTEYMRHLKSQKHLTADVFCGDFILPPRKCEHKHLFHRFVDGGRDFCGSGYDPGDQYEYHGSFLNGGFTNIGYGCGWRHSLKVPY